MNKDKLLSKLDVCIADAMKLEAQTKETYDLANKALAKATVARRRAMTNRQRLIQFRKELQKWDMQHNPTNTQIVANAENQSNL